MKKGIVLFMVMIIGWAAVLKVMEFNSDVYRNTRSLEKYLESNQRSEGLFSSMIDFEVDQIIVLDHKLTQKEIFALLGFEDSLIKESEAGMHNIVFLKEKKIVGYLHGYHSFQLIVPAGIYDKSQINSMMYAQHQHIYTILVQEK